jgi:M6 family metalloprotease-like protein
MCIVLSGAYLVLGVSPVEASPADPRVVKTFVQPDGTVIQLRLWGDEFMHGWETLDGYTVNRNSDSGYWEYAIQDSSGQLVPSGAIVGRAKPPTTPGLRPSLAAVNLARAVRGVQPLGIPVLAASPPWAGADTDVLFIMAEFTDMGCSFTDAQMQTNLFGGGASGPGDLDDYFDEISYGNLQLDGRVEGGTAGCYALANNHTHYDQGPGSAESLVQEAIALADPDVDFSVYDNDGDGFVDALGIIYAGGGPHDGCETDDDGAGGAGDELWPHSWHLSSAVTVDGVKVYNYIIQSEITYGIGDGICDEMQTIGLFAHEFGHALGLPDLYDTDGSSSGVGSWSSMASQFRSTVNNADTPPHYDPWSKWFQGWITPIDYTGLDINGALPQVETNPAVIQLLANPGGPEKDGSGEYFLVENRQLVNFDSQLPGCGTLIWHIEESQSTNKNEGHTAGSHRLVDLEEADGQDDLDRNPATDPAANRGDGGDPFPGTSNNMLFNDSTTPHALLYDGTSTNQVKVEMVSTGCEATMLVNFGDIPVADPGGPYVTNEGVDIGLDGTGSTNPDAGPLRCDWDLDDDGLFDDANDDCTPTFNMVGQDGVFPIALKVTDTSDGVFDTDETTVTVANVAPSLSLASDAPENEGSTVTVSGTATDPGWLDPLTADIDWDDGTPVETIIGGILENIRPDATLTFNTTHEYGDNGDYDVEVCVDDDDTTTCQIILVHIDNVPPTVSIDPAQVTTIDEGDLVDVLAHFSDPGWLDTYTSLIDWGTGESEPGSIAVTVQGPPLDQGQVTGSHQYGDNGFFPVTVTVTDDDGGSGSDGFDLTVNNVDPTAEIDESDAIMINGNPTFLAHAGDPLDFSGRSTDPGSDDLTLGWDWDDGPPSPDVSNVYLVNPPHPDPFPSPSVQPRDVTDTKTHAFADACLYQISFLADDDDSGHGEDQAMVIITGNADKARSEGYWEHQYSGNGKIDFDQDTLECYLAIVGYVSTVFDEKRDASTIEQAHDVLFLKQNKGSPEEQFDRELLTVWLNFANGAIEYDELLGVATAETVRLDPSTTKKEIKEQTNILHHIKQNSR